MLVNTKFTVNSRNCDNYGKGCKNNQGYGLHKLTCRKYDMGNNTANIMKPNGITRNVKLMVKNTVNDMVNRVGENINNDTPSPVIIKDKRKRNANRREKYTARFKTKIPNSREVLH